MSARRAYFSVPPAVKTDRPLKDQANLQKKILLYKQDFQYQNYSSEPE